MDTERRVVISGCSGGGKSTLLAALAARGFCVVEEPGRRIVAEELARGGRALPWVDAETFARRAVAVARADRAGAEGASGWTFFDRGLVDAAVALDHLTGEPAAATLGAKRYHARVFLAPPWPEIYRTDPERRHGFEEAVAEHERLLAAYAALGYQVVPLPKIAVERRADFVLAALGASPG